MAKDGVRVELNMPQILSKVDNDTFGLFVINEWYRLMQPYTPHRTGLMEQTVSFKPFEVKYLQPYSRVNYESKNRTFRTDFNPFATDHWDKKAEEAGQKDRLYTAINNYLRKRG